MIAVAQEKLNKMDYAGAILAFHKALGGANDELGYVYSQMGECYRARNENRNAITCYERGRDEYRKLITAGRQIERAGAGIRICETGIKICSNE
jgi:tetratricopeptide (TPR) repeat protein